MVKSKKKLIEVALPLDAINIESLRRKQKAPKGWPTSFHKWWAQRPLAAARAVIFAQMIDDPSSNPDLFPTVKAQEKERQRLFKIIEEFVLWDNTWNIEILQKAQNEIWQSWRRACAENIDHPKASILFDRHKLPVFYDPFAGSGSLPLSAQWLGLESYASDLNPVAVLLNQAMIEIPPKFNNKPPINPKTNENVELFQKAWKGAQGLAEDVRYYGQWIKDEALRQIGNMYPAITVTAEMAIDRDDLQPLVGHKLNPVAFIWTRTVKSPNPAFTKIDVPLASTFLLSSKVGKEVYVEPIVKSDGYNFLVRLGKPKNVNSVKNGTKLGRGANFQCIMSDTPIPSDYIYSEATGKRLGTRLMAVVVEGAHGRLYLPATREIESIAFQAQPSWKPEVLMPKNGRWFSPPLYGLLSFGDLFTDRQLLSLTTFSDLIEQARDRAKQDAIQAGLVDDQQPLISGGMGANAYGDAIAVYLGCVVDRMAYYGSSLTTWLPKDNALRDCMPRQALAMAWDFAEGNPFAKSSGDITTCTKAVASYLDAATPNAKGHAIQSSAQTGVGMKGMVISTDPPYYDNIGYADLSDYFYVWLRRSIRSVFPDLFATVAVPKSEELVATPYRHGSKEKAETFFLDGMTQVMHRLVEQSHPAFPITIYYAFKQSENENESGVASTGWETFLGAVIASGLSVTGTWPMRTEGEGRMIASDTNALASCIVLVCRPLSPDAVSATRREFISALKTELPTALTHLQRGNIAPVDLAQAAIGPGMAVFTRFNKVSDAEGKSLTVRDALALINQVLDESLAEQEGDFDAGSRWAVAWFDQYGFDDGEFGVADVLARAKNTSVQVLSELGIIESKRGKVRLIKVDELSHEWNPATHDNLSGWDIVHHLIRILQFGGESAASIPIKVLGSKAEIARELAYRLYALCERRKRAQDALMYNGLVQSWPEIVRLAKEDRSKIGEQSTMFN